MTKAVVFLVTLLFVLPHGGSAQRLTQSDSTSSDKKVSLMGQLWGPEILGGHLNFFLHDRLSINFGIGLNFDAHLGSNVYLKNRNSSARSLYVGAQVIHYRQFLLSGSNAETQLGIYLPLGYESVSSSGFTFQIEAGPNFVSKDWSQTNTLPFIASVRIGKTFGES